MGLTWHEDPRIREQDCESDRGGHCPLCLDSTVCEQAQTYCHVGLYRSYTRGKKNFIECMGFLLTKYRRSYPSEASHILSLLLTFLFPSLYPRCNISRELSGSTGNKEGKIGTSQIRIVLLQVSSRRVGFRCGKCHQSCY